MRKQLTHFPSISALMLGIFAILLLVGVYFEHRLALNQVFIMDADNLELPLLIKTVLFNHFPYHSWYLCTAPFFFPTGFITLISYLLSGGNLYYAFAFQMGLQILLLGILTYWFVCQFLQKNVAIIVTTFIVSGVCYACYLLPGDRQIEDRAILAIGHFDSFLSYLFVLSIFFQKISSPPKGWVSASIILILCSSLTSFSDGFFYIYMATIFLAVVHLYCHNTINLKEVFRWGVIFLISILLGKLMTQFFLPHKISYNPAFSIKYFERNIHDVINIINQISVRDFFYYHQIWLGFITIAYLIFFSVFIFLSKIKLTLKTIKIDKAIIALISINVFLFILSFLAILFIDKRPARRYMIALYFLPAITMLILILLPKYTRKVISSILLLLSIFMVFNMTYHFFLTPIKFKASYLPPDYQCIYQVVHRYHLQHGISGYWESAPLMYFSKDDNFHVAAYGEYGNGEKKVLGPTCWANSSKWYHKYYDFMVYYPNLWVGWGGRLLPYKKIIQNNAKPIETVVCNHHVIVVYPKNTLSVGDNHC